jgi:hypothetical protein
MKRRILFTMLGLLAAVSMTVFLGCDDVSSSTDDSTDNSTTTVIYYKVTYDANGGTTAATDESKYRSGTEATVVTTYDVSTYKTASGGKYLLKNWNTKKDGSGTSYSAGDTIKIYADTTLYAQWESHYVGEYVSGSDVFGNTVSGYIAYIKKDGATEFTYYSADGFSSTSYTINSTVGGKSWSYLVAVIDGTTASKSYKYKNLSWAPNATTSVSGLSVNLGAGKANSDAIIAAYTSATISDCAAKALETTDKCYLPSVGEMAAIYKNLFYSGTVTPPTYATGSIGSVSYYYTSCQADETNAKAFDMYKSSINCGKSVSYTKTPASTATWPVWTLGVTYMAE